METAEVAAAVAPVENHPEPIQAAPPKPKSILDGLSGMAEAEGWLIDIVSSDWNFQLSSSHSQQY